MEGNTDGFCVGDVGLKLGTLVGTLEGITLGKKVGAHEGIDVGF